jgi:hypothetical protein
MARVSSLQAGFAVFSLVVPADGDAPPITYQACKQDLHHLAWIPGYSDIVVPESIKPACRFPII